MISPPPPLKFQGSWEHGRYAISESHIPCMQNTPAILISQKGVLGKMQSQMSSTRKIDQEIR